MKKFIYLLDILLLLLIPTTLYVAVENDTVRYRTSTVSSAKMINTTILLDRSNKKKEIREEEERQREAEEEEARQLALKEEQQKKNNEAVIKANAIQSAPSVTQVQVVEQVSALESSGNSNHDNNQSSSGSPSDDNVGTTTTVTVGSSEKAYVGYTFSGNMSAYGRDCCSSNPDLWGITASGFNIFTNGMYYNDATYGRVRIIAASRDDFYLYSVIKITDPIDGEYNAIVLDRGDGNIGIGRRFVFDLVVESQEWARLHYGVHRNVNFEVLRIGR